MTATLTARGPGCSRVTVTDSGNWLKIESRWWKKIGYRSSFTARIGARMIEELQQVRTEEEQVERGRGQHHSVRVALTGLPQDARSVEIASLFRECCRVDMIYSLNGKFIDPQIRRR